MRVCLIYDCLFPYTIGGAERWYRNVGERLARDGHEVTYLTMRQWERGHEPALDGVRVVAVAPRLRLYTRDGRRAIVPPLIFGAGVLAHLLVHGRRYEVVHTASFPYFSLVAAGLTRRLAGFRLVADWHEVWTREYWSEYLGRGAGAAGSLVQRACARIPQRAFCFSQLHARRLREEGVRGEVTVLEGEYAGSGATDPVEADATVVFAGRLIPEKRAVALVEAMAVVRGVARDLRCDIYGDGPERAAVAAAIQRLGLRDVVRLRGFVPAAELEAAMSRALCVVLPSKREGYGMVVVEAATRGVPSIVVAEPDNAATELIEEGVNGFIVSSADPERLARAIVAVRDGGFELRDSTARWYRRNERRLSLDNSLDVVARSYTCG